MNKPEQLAYHHLYTDAQGETHFASRQFEFKQRQDIIGVASINVSELQGVRAAMLYNLASGAVEDWHNTPRKQFAFVVQGQVEVTASDGEVVHLEPGGIMLLDDTTGKGHVTANVGPGEFVVLMVPVVE